MPLPVFYKLQFCGPTRCKSLPFARTRTKPPRLHWPALWAPCQKAPAHCAPIAGKKFFGAQPVLQHTNARFGGHYRLPKRAFVKIL